MNWTTTPPEVAGYYWMKTTTGYVSVVEVRLLDGEVQWRPPVPSLFKPLGTERDNVQWAGPIPEPEDA